MERGRLEAFNDAVIAIIMTLMVLELRPPGGTDFAALAEKWPTFLCYILSFVNLAIYWNNHHHMFQRVDKVNGAVLWANNHLLFWLSLFPFATAWMGEQNFRPIPVAAYGAVLLLAGISYYILCLTLIGANGRDSALAKSLGRDVKGKVSPLVYLVAIPTAFAVPYVSCALYGLVAAMWLVPDRRFET